MWGFLSRRIPNLGRSWSELSEAFSICIRIICWTIFMLQCLHPVTATMLLRLPRNLTYVPVSGVLGRSVLLPCNVSMGTKDADRPVLILWYKVGIEAPIYSVDGRDSEITQGGHWSSELVLERRATFLWLSESPSEKRQNPPRHSSSTFSDKTTAVQGLQLRSLFLTDASIYRCRVDYKEAQTRNMLINLTIIVPPLAPTIKNEQGMIVPSIAGPFLEGTTLRLTCESSTGSPPSSLLWYRNGELWDSSFTVGVNGTTKNDVKLERLRRSDINTILSCEAFNNPETTPASTFVIVDLLLAPLEVTILETAEPVVMASHLYNLSCQTSGSRPPPVIAWFIGQERVTNTIETVSHDGNVTTSLLQYRPSIEDQAKLIRCSVQNLKLSTTPLQVTKTIDLKFRPQVTVETLEMETSANITEGRDLYLVCNVIARPPISKMEWQVNGNKLNSNSSLGIYIKGNTLTLRRTNISRSGTYSCVAWNSLGNNRSDFIVDIVRIPECSFQHIPLFYMEAGASVGIFCNISHLRSPESVNYHWTLKRSGHVRDVANSSIPSFTYSVRGMMDYGSLQCTASNSATTQISSPCTFTIKPSGPPETPTNCSSSSASSLSVKIVCQNGSDQGYHQSFSLLIFNRSFLWRNLSDASRPEFEVTGLESGREYLASVYAVNEKGQSRRMNFTFQGFNEPIGQPTVAESGNDNKRLTGILTPTILTVMGVSTAVCSLLLLFLGILCRMKFRSQSSSSPMIVNPSPTVEISNNAAMLDGRRKTELAASPPIRNQHDSQPVLMAHAVAGSVFPALEHLRSPSLHPSVPSRFL